MHVLRTWLGESYSSMVNDLKHLITIHPAVDSKASVDLLGTWFREQFEKLGAIVQTVPQADVGDFVLARWGSGRSQLLIIGHLDVPTIVGGVEGCPPVFKNGHLYGPGVAMKSGVVQLLYALKTIHAAGYNLGLPLTVLLTTDYEKGSFISRDTLLAETRQSVCVLGLQPALPPRGALRTSTLGSASYEIRIRGRAAHSGAAPEDGRSAIDELAGVVQKLYRLPDQVPDSCVNVGLVRGGSRPNVIASFAEAEVEVRFRTLLAGSRLDDAICSLIPEMDGIQLEVRGGIERPPMERVEGVTLLFKKAQECAEDLGINLSESMAFEPSDIGFAVAEGVPAIDGLGVIGGGEYSFAEWVDVSRIPERSALLAALLLQLSRTDPNTLRH